MADDNSIATQVENFVVTQLHASGTPAIEAHAYAGPQDPGDGNVAPAELFQTQVPLALVRWSRCELRELDARDYQLRSLYDVYLCVPNKRGPDPATPGACRRGDGTVQGTNALRDLIKERLHNQHTGVTGTECLHLGEQRTVYEAADRCIVLLTVICPEVYRSS